MGQLLALPGTVSEIKDGASYDVTAFSPPQLIGEAVPAWVARIIAACEPGPVLVRVHQGN